jgi:glycosyltransferase involved in cell wall biosynthesis
MILLISAVFPPEPVVSATIAHDLAVTLSDELNVRVLTPRPSRPYGFTFDHGFCKPGKFEHVIVPSYTCPRSVLFGRMRESFSFGKHVARYIRENHEKLAIVYLITWPLLSQYLIVRSARKYAIPSIVHVQDIYPESLENKVRVCCKIIRSVLLPLDTYILKNATHVVAVSENMKSRLIHTRGISPEKISLIQNWQDEADFIKYHYQRHKLLRRNPVEKPFTFMYLGNIGPVAGVDFLIRSFALANIANARLIIAGSGSMKEECRQIADTYKNAPVLFWNVPAGKVPEIQAQADVMLLPVKRGAAMSSVPSKLIAYLFSKKPVIACVDHNSDTAKAIEQAGCGWVIPPEETDVLARTLQSVAQTPKTDLLIRGMNGFNYASDNFSKKNNLKKLVHLIIQNSRKNLFQSAVPDNRIIRNMN